VSLHHFSASVGRNMAYAGSHVSIVCLFLVRSLLRTVPTRGVPPKGEDGNTESVSSELRKLENDELLLKKREFIISAPTHSSYVNNK